MILTVTPNPAVDRVYRIDGFEMGKVHRPESVTVSAGGKGINVARVSKILGADVCALGFTGGSSGSFIESEVKKLGIHCAFTSVSGETRINVNITDENGRSGEILGNGPFVTENERQAFESEFLSRIGKCSIAAASGSLPQGLDSDFYCFIVNKSNEAGVPIVADTSGKALCEVVKHKPFMVKPNTDELLQLFGQKPSNDSEIKECLVKMHEMGVCVPLVTLGADGAAAYVEGKCIKFTPPKINAVNTVGSGDSTVGGICTGIDKGIRISESIKLGVACGTANTQFEQTGVVSKELVSEYYNKISVKVL